jgi:hypothetical protein
VVKKRREEKRRIVRNIKSLEGRAENVPAFQVLRQCPLVLSVEVRMRR